MISKFEIIYKLLVLYIFKQNKHFERKNDFIAIKTRVFQIHVNFLFSFWSWIVRATQFLMNTISIKKHKWRIFFEIIIDMKSNLFHFYKFDCKIYFLNNIIFLKKKLQKRTHIDHLLIDWLIEFISRCDIYLSRPHAIAAIESICSRKSLWAIKIYCSFERTFVSLSIIFRKE